MRAFLPSPNLFRLFLSGCLAILFQVALGTVITAYTQPPVWIAAAFLIGVVLGIVITQRTPGMAFPAMGLLALTGVGPVFTVDAPLRGEVVNLRQVDDIPATFSVAGYTAPGWRINDSFSRKERLTAGRPSREYGHRIIAPLVGEGWTPAHPVEVWVAGEIRNSGRAPPSHPKFWAEPGGEFVRLVGANVSGAQLQALRAAKEHGLQTAQEPLIVTRTTSVSQSMNGQYLRLVWSLRWPFGAWTLLIGVAAAMDWARAQPPFFRRRR